MNLKLITSLFVIFIFQACNLKNVEENMKKDSEMPNIKITNTSAAKEKTDPRSQIPINPEQLSYYINSINIAIKVISGGKDLTDSDPLLGTAEDSSPKGPGAKLVRSYSKEIDGKVIGIYFTRKENNHLWYLANIADAPENHPKGVYLMDLPVSFFNGMVLEKAYTTTANGPNDSSKPKNIFIFFIVENNIKIKLVFESRPDVSKIEDKYPKSFSFVEISRDI